MLGSAWGVGFQKGYLLFIKNEYIYGYSSGIYVNPHLRLAGNSVI